MTESEFISKAQPLFQSIYRRNSGGCCLHVIIDDQNWDCGMDDSDLRHKDCRELYKLIHNLDELLRERINYDHETGVLSFNIDDEDCCPCCGRRM